MSTGIDSNVWYQFVYTSSGTQNAMQAYDVNSSGSAAIVANRLNASTVATSFEWQLLPLGPPDTYAVRSRSLGNQYYMGVFYAPVSTLPNMDTRIAAWKYQNPALAVGGAQWIIQSTGDGTGMYYLSAVSNTTAWHLDMVQGICYMRDANGLSTTNSAKWSLSSVSAINNAQWSYTPTSTSSATSTPSGTTISNPASNSATTTSTSTNSSSQQAADTSNNDAGVPMGAVVGGVIGGVAILLLLFGALFIYRRRKRSSPKMTGYNSSPPSDHTELEARHTFTEPYGTVLAKDNSGIYEKPRSPLDEKQPMYQAWEQPVNQPAVELPAGEARSWR